MKRIQPKQGRGAGPRRLCRRADLQIHPLADGCVVYQPDQERVHFLNLTAAAVLELCDGRHDAASLEAAMVVAVGAQGPRRKLTGGAVQQLIEAGLVTVAGGATA
ncbi:MAG: hypothetical protein NTV49_08845 [Kiritimatiellaeota bacterium]|nr:hypothetical protein [Kiritimatiellota bacterium]